jgi:hypothetical protein
MSLPQFNFLDIYREAGLGEQQTNLSQALDLYGHSTKGKKNENPSARYLWNSLVSHFPANLSFAYIPQMQMDNSEG